MLFTIQRPAGNPVDRLPLAAIILLVVALVIHAPRISAQTDDGAVKPAAKAIAMAAKLPAYDVVSIRENRTGKEETLFETTDDGVIVENCTLLQIVQAAYGLGNPDLISGISGPLDSARFDIKAKIAASDGATPRKFTDDELQAMTIPLLADRFHLKVHLSPKVTTVYEIVVAKGGPRFRLTEPDTNTGSVNLGTSGMNNTIVAKKSDMATLSSALSDCQLHAIVVDRTGLKGEGDFTLSWSSDAALEQGSPNAISVFTAMQDQLGLKLQPAKLSVDTLVIDHAEMPSTN
jgi:uncharacterized protein (TIGR03435 family)